MPTLLHKQQKQGNTVFCKQVHARSTPLVSLTLYLVHMFAYVYGALPLHAHGVRGQSVGTLLFHHRGLEE